jgi:PKD repeat protein
MAVALLGLAADAGAVRADSTFPPIRVFPAAGDSAPPSTVVSDPGVSDATCSGWYRQSSYVGQVTSVTWWEYYCHRVWPPDGTGASNADHGGQDIFDDYFYWNGSAPVLYGGWAYYGYWDEIITATDCSYWTYQPANLSYGPLDEAFHPLDCSGSDPSPPPNAAPVAAFNDACAGLRCSFNAGGSSDSDGTIQTYAWDFGDGTTAGGLTAKHTYQLPGTYTARLTVTDNGGASTAASKNMTVSNLPPTASFTVACTGRGCHFDGQTSVDRDGTIQTYAWTFADGTTATGETASHTYAQAGSYTATLTVTDNAGASAKASKTAAPITLTGHRVAASQTAHLSWRAPTGATITVYRDGLQIATVQSITYTNTVPGTGSHNYQVCAAAFSSCSNQVTLSF